MALDNDARDASGKAGLPSVANPLVAAHWGLYRPVVENGRTTGLRPYEGDPDPSPIGTAVVGARLSPARILRPAVRKSFLERGAAAGGEGRGAEPFVEVDWDTVLALTAGGSAGSGRRTATARSMAAPTVGEVPGVSITRNHRCIAFSMRSAATSGACRTIRSPLPT